jgi:CheY-like chemotaxis protein
VARPPADAPGTPRPDPDDTRSGHGADSALRALRRQRNSQPAPLEPATGHCRVLVADEHADYLATLGELLELHDYDVLCVNDGRALVAAVEHFRPHAILMDLRLAALDVFGAVQAIRALPGSPQPHIAAVTTQDSRDLRERIARSGIDSHHVKPIDTRALLRLLDAIASRADTPR